MDPRTLAYARRKVRRVAWIPAVLAIMALLYVICVVWGMYGDIPGIPHWFLGYGVVYFYAMLVPYVWSLVILFEHNELMHDVAIVQHYLGGATGTFVMFTSMLRGMAIVAIGGAPRDMHVDMAVFLASATVCVCSSSCIAIHRVAVAVERQIKYSCAVYPAVYLQGLEQL